MADGGWETVLRLRLRCVVDCYCWRAGLDDSSGRQTDRQAGSQPASVVTTSTHALESSLAINHVRRRRRSALHCSLPRSDRRPGNDNGQQQLDAANRSIPCRWASRTDSFVVAWWDRPHCTTIVLRCTCFCAALWIIGYVYRRIVLIYLFYLMTLRLLNSCWFL